MPGNFQQHLDEFGLCQCGRRRSGTEFMRLETYEQGRGWRYENVPACADCFGLI